MKFLIPILLLGLSGYVMADEHVQKEEVAPAVEAAAEGEPGTPVVGEVVAPAVEEVAPAVEEEVKEEESK